MSFEPRFPGGLSPAHGRLAAFLLLLIAPPLARAQDCDAPFEPCGNIRCWNILGPLLQSFGDSPGEDNARLDYLTDGNVSELDFVFEPGAPIWPDFRGAAASDGIFFPDPLNRNPRAIDGAVTVFPYDDPDGFIDLNDEVFGGDPDLVMAYAQCYVISDSDRDREAFVEVSLDDAMQVIWNGEEVWINGGPANIPDAEEDEAFCAPDHRSLRPVTILPCENRLVVKIFEGFTEWEFLFRFVDAGGNPLTEADGLSISRFPRGDCLEKSFVRGDANADGEQNVTDGIRLLGHLFQGEIAPPCREAADIDGDDSLGLTDVVFLMEFLFRGGPQPPTPFPDCGPDPGPGAPDCESFPPCAQ